MESPSIRRNRIALFPSNFILSHPFHCSCRNSTHLGHNSLALEASPHAVVDTLGLPPALADAVEAVTLVTLELRSALLDDRDMLLCGNHLYGCRLVIAPVGDFAAGKLESKSWICSARASLAIDVLLRCWRCRRCRRWGRWSIHDEVLVSRRCSTRTGNSASVLAAADFRQDPLAQLRSR
jgi:hypothetical protein